jgi:hypothetical protein
MVLLVWTMALGAGYVSNALTSPALYRAMFDVAAELEDPQAATATFQVLVTGAERAQQAGRFLDCCDPQALGTQFWAVGHGLSMLVLSGVLPAAGDRPERCRHSVQAGWSTFAARPKPESR